MREYNANKPLISIHVPKCAGTSFQEVIKDWFGQKGYMHYRKGGQLPSKITLDPGSCLHGHFNRMLDFGIEKHYSDVSQFITILRDPIEMQVFMYYDELRRHHNGNTAWDWKREGVPHSLDHFL